MNRTNLKLLPFYLITITVIVFSPTFFNDFQRSWDDQWMLLEQPFIVNFSWDGLWYHCLNFYHSQYSPVITVFYLVIYSLFGFNAGIFHTACLLVHVVNVLLAFFLIRNVLKEIKPGWKSKKNKMYAMFTALIFAIHPLQVESVAWISGSKAPLYTFFILLGLLFYLKYIREIHWGWYAGVIICYLLSFGAKEQAIIFPLNLILFDWVLNRYKGIRLNFKAVSQKVILEKIPFFILAGGMWYFSLQNNLGGVSADTYPLSQRLLFGMSSFMDYLFRFLAPVKLFYLYFFPVSAGEKLPLYYWGYPLLVLICIAFVVYNYNRNNRLVVFGFWLFLINILLVLHFIPMPRYAITADRYMYFSTIGLGLAAVWLGNYFVVRKPKWKKFLIPLFAVWLLFLGTYSFRRTTDWKDSDSIRQNVNELIERRKEQGRPVADNLQENGDHENNNGRGRAVTAGPN